MTFDDLAVRLKERVQDERERARENIADGIAKDWGEYRFSMGYIRAMRDIELIIDEIVADLIKGGD